jgi:6-phosphogluconate dehydrogenase (decarboxylating)
MIAARYHVIRPATAARGSGAVLVVGLGRFGSDLAEGLERLGHEVLAVDMSYERVQEWADRLTHVTQVDSTNPTAMYRSAPMRWTSRWSRSVPASRPVC